MISNQIHVPILYLYFCLLNKIDADGLVFEGPLADQKRHDLPCHVSFMCHAESVFPYFALRKGEHAEFIVGANKGGGSLSSYLEVI